MDMKLLSFLFALLLNACTCSTNINNRTIAIGNFSCYNSQCCYPYLHHKDVKDYHVMVCSHEKINQDGLNSANLSVKVYFSNP